MAGQNSDLVAMFSCNCHCNGMPGLGRETPHDRAIMGASRDHLMPLINQTQEISISFALFRSPILSARLSMNVGDVKGVEELIYCGTASDSEIREGVQCSCNQAGEMISMIHFLFICLMRAVSAAFKFKFWQVHRSGLLRAAHLSLA